MPTAISVLALTHTKALTALGHRCIQRQDGDDSKDKLEILAWEVQAPARESLEAFWIFARKPAANSKG
ncbi:unnamed protein product [Nippostrongylus brasiliensis]|uniref:Methyltransferase n=1 Tax=Nippostrongylus brasiliensis TaxID=27835 RepID=A0A0N4YLB9_NIPBR|nr:unnamed protein product [Nippostrongylus brasiliensis]